MKGSTDKEWFADWFDSPYYHILYKFRDHEEAEFLIDSLVAHLQLPENARVLDLACGKGRHSIYLHKKGLDVTGMDLSPASIAEAKKSEAPGLQFEVHDMREPIPGERFDTIFNLFTSFGYFEDHGDHIKALRAVHQGIVPGGRFVMDYLNASKLSNELVAEEEKTVEGIVFKIKRWSADGFICKQIAFTDKGESYVFQEKVRSFTLEDLEKAFFATGLQIISTFGDYALQPYDPTVSDRLILVAQPVVD